MYIHILESSRALDSLRTRYFGHRPLDVTLKTTESFCRNI